MGAAVSIVHAVNGTVGERRPLRVHCRRGDCQGTAKRMTDGNYQCSISRGGCGLRFELDDFDVPADRPKLTGGHWVLRDWDPALGKPGVWMYER